MEKFLRRGSGSVREYLFDPGKNAAVKPACFGSSHMIWYLGRGGVSKLSDTRTNFVSWVTVGCRESS